ncbi:hypothetical protein FQN60_012678 [Etheostoma spectabile]|uniref:Uncharacterized protein n=1 Tax=Etheostoma spectabile TaxID=54343 RepID=A0A5J5D8D9_9PERO|nr:hypothetical protein FQN60_012678 [Etheostoma spectabile]
MNSLEPGTEDFSGGGGAGADQGEVSFQISWIPMKGIQAVQGLPSIRGRAMVERRWRAASSAGADEPSSRYGQRRGRVQTNKWRGRVQTNNWRGRVQTKQLERQSAAKQLERQSADEQMEGRCRRTMR